MSDVAPIFSETAVDFGGPSGVFPVYFIAGTIFQGTAVLLIVAAIARAVSSPASIVTEKHIDWMCKVVLLSGTVVGTPTAWNSSWPTTAAANTKGKLPSC